MQDRATHPPKTLTVFVVTLALYGTSSGRDEIKLTPFDGSPGDLFGRHLDIDGSYAIVGALGNSEGGVSSGSAYLFSTLTGQLIWKLRPSDGASGDFFGRGVGISGNTVAVGAYRNGTTGGSAYLFDASSGQQIAKLVPNDGARSDYFGSSVDIDGTFAIFGSVGDDDNGSESGSAYVFDTTTHQQFVKLLPNDGAASDQFGDSVAIDGILAVVGARGNDDFGSMSGAAYVFDVRTGEQLHKLLPEDGAADHLFGASSSIDGTTILVGARQADANGVSSGAAYVFDAVSGRQLFKLVPEDGADGDLFGYSVSIDGTTAIVGAFADDDNGMASGSAYAFDLTTGRQLTKILASDGSADDFFGRDVGIDGANILVGAFGDVDRTGAAYLLSLAVPRASWRSYGTGWPGTLGVPTLIPHKDPSLGTDFTLEIGNSLGAGTIGLLALGFTNADTQTGLGGSLLVEPSSLIILSIPGPGLLIEESIPDDTSLCGLSLFVQVLESDLGASHGVSFTAGLELTLGL